MAWNAGHRNVAELARTAGVSRTTIYADLHSNGITFYTRRNPAPMTRPHRPEATR
jgi:hypothetical protein